MGTAPCRLNPFGTASSIGIATDYGLGDRGARLRAAVGSRIATSACCVDWLWGPPGALSPVLKWQEREADHLAPTAVEVKKTLTYTSTPSIRLHNSSA
jgi:hypothetical protein